MQYYRCRCGLKESIGSAAPPPCYGCPECGTTLEIHPDNHRKPAEHQFVAICVEAEDGTVEWTRCRVCGESKKRPEPAAK